MSLVSFLNNLFKNDGFELIDSNSKKIGKLKVPKNINYDQLIKSCDIGLSTVMVTKSFFKNNLFSSLKTKED